MVAHRRFCFSVSASARARGMGKQKLKKQQKKVARKQLAHPKAKSEPTPRREALSVATLHRSLEEASASTAARAKADAVRSNKKRRSVGAEECAQLSAVLQDASFQQDPTGAIRAHLTALRDLKQSKQRDKGRGK